MSHPLKPESVLCRLKQLMKWTGWSKDEVRKLSDAKVIKVVRIVKPVKSGQGRSYYDVASVERVIS